MLFRYAAGQLFTTTPAHPEAGEAVAQALLASAPGSILQIRVYRRMSDVIPIELILLSIRTIKDAEHALTFKVQRDDVNRINFAAKIGHQFAATETYPQPAQEDRQRHMAARSETPNRYTQRAVILCKDFEFQQFLALDFPGEAWADALRQFIDFRLIRPDSFDTDIELRIALAKSAVLRLMGDIESRKEIIEGTTIGDLWERLMDRFAKWKEQRAADQLTNG